MDDSRQVWTVEITLSVDAAGAGLLPDWPGSISPVDPTEADPPISGIEMALMDAAQRAVDTLQDNLSTVLDSSFLRINLCRWIEK